MLTYTTMVRAEWGDCGPTRQVHYPRFFDWVNPACHEMLDAGGLHHEVLRDKYRVRGVMLKSVNMKYRLPAYLKDELNITSAIDRLGRTSFTIVHTALRGADLIITGEETRMWVVEHPDDPQRIIAEPIPDKVRAIMQGG